MLDSNIDAIVRQIQDQLVEKLARNLIQWNFGWRDDWGKFERQPHTDPQFLLSRASSLITAMSSQIIPNTDLDAVNRLREDLGVAALSQESLLSLVSMQTALAQSKDDVLE